MPPKKSARKLDETATSPTEVVVAASENRKQVLHTISSELKKARARVQLSITDLHKKTGISRTVLQGYEAGRFAPGSPELKKLCETLNVSPNQVIFGREAPLEDKSALADFVGDLGKAQNTARLTIAAQLLTPSELRAMLSLIESIALPRLGGKEHLDALIASVGLLFDEKDGLLSVLEGTAEDVAALVSEEKIKALAVKLDEAAAKAPKRK
ncbi:MAG: helix-turn-helix transcriptional regulator [Hylemonella sp.]|uniref:helix-turn-helix domain-containing protein n=1 Tax=Hylemonella sp. TaxID=2066020 RepID=UPI0022C3809F|nr:helix-turn-helix transcriptional regulator [Hylemonella sp.]MCZ8253422.1 helix-turn-helix transcriptional regulator [Hylemonella sp.]